MGYDVLRSVALGAILGLAGCELVAGLNTHERRAQDAGGTSTCSDGSQNGKETDVDCGGGQCLPCEQGQRCLVGADCADQVCANGICAAPTCSDNAKNGDETGVDCGGAACPKCSAGEGCASGSDCISGVCTSMTCESSCTDQVKDGDESDVDCGGKCPACVLGATCTDHVDCASGVCQGGKCVDFVAWTVRLGGMSGTDSTRLAALGVDTSGNAVVAANFSGKLGLGGSSSYDTGSVSSQGFAFGRYDPMGNHIWDSGYVSGSTLKSQSVRLLAVGASGGFVALGDYESPGINFGNGVTLPSVSPAPVQAFTVSFNPANVPTLARKYGGTSGLNGSAFGGLATDAQGSSIVFAGGGNFGSYNLNTINSTSVAIQNGDLFVVNVTSNWGKTFNDGGSSDAFVGVARDAMGGIVAAGQHHGIINFGGGPVDSATAGEGFVVKLTSSGTFSWIKSFAAAPDQLAVDPQGNAAVCGEFSGSVDFGLGPLTGADGAVFVAKLDASGNAVWNKAFAGTGATATVTSLVTTDAAGNVLLAINAPGATFDFDGDSLNGSFFLAKLDANGTLLWSKGFGSGKLDRVAGIAAYSADEVLLGGNFQGTLSFGSKMVSSLGGTDIFLARLRLPN
jgi:hypothetical protein